MFTNQPEHANIEVDNGIFR